MAAHGGGRGDVTSVRAVAPPPPGGPAASPLTLTKPFSWRRGRLRPTPQRLPGTGCSVRPAVTRHASRPGLAALALAVVPSDPVTRLRPPLALVAARPLSVATASRCDVLFKFCVGARSCGGVFLGLAHVAWRGALVAVHVAGGRMSPFLWPSDIRSCGRAAALPTHPSGPFGCSRVSAVVNDAAVNTGAGVFPN